MSADTAAVLTNPLAEGDAVAEENEESDQNENEEPDQCGCCPLCVYYIECRKKIGKATCIFLGVGLGVLCGTLMKGTDADTFTFRILVGVPGYMWITALKCMVVPLIFTNMITGVLGMRSQPSGGEAGKNTVQFEVTTSIIAAIIALLVVVCMLIPLTVPPPGINVTTSKELAEEGGPATDSNPGIQLAIVFQSFVPNNIVKAMADMDLLGMIMFAICLACYLPTSGSIIESVSAELNNAVMGMVGILILIAPFGLFSMMWALFMTIDFTQVAGPVVVYLLCDYFGLLIQMWVVYPVCYFAVTRKNPFPYMLTYRRAWITALSTSSSAATLPTTMACAENNKIPKALAKFTLSIGATVNMDGSTIGFFCSIVWLAIMVGHPVDFGFLITSLVVTVLSAMGAAPIPGAGGVLIIGAVQAAFGAHAAKAIDSPYLMVLIAINPIVDNFETMVNITGDSIAVGVIHHLHGEAFADGTQEGVELADNPRWPSLRSGRSATITSSFGRGLEVAPVVDA